MLKRVDFEKLCDLPSIDNQARAVKIARFCLSSSEYVFDDDRVKIVFDCHNKFRTLTFAEIMAMKQAFLYVLLEKLYFVYSDLITIAKFFNLAKSTHRTAN